jgi:hypothetical protein
MEFHIPFFALRPAPRSDQRLPPTRKKCLRSWEDITLLTKDTAGADGNENYRIHRAQISCVVHGSNEWQWTAWAFEDTNHDWEEEDDIYADATTHNDEVVFIEDPITCGLDANKPIWRPREYFVKALEIRMKDVRDEWDYLVYRLQLDRKRNVCSNNLLLLSSFRSNPDADV